MLGAHGWNTDRSGSDTCTLVRGRIGQPLPSADFAVRDPADDLILPPVLDLLRSQVTDEAVPAILRRPTVEPARYEDLLLRPERRTAVARRARGAAGRRLRGAPRWSMRMLPWLLGTLPPQESMHRWFPAVVTGAPISVLKAV
jgi:hypothetical protein